jgi:hypothetical protein
MQRGHVTEGRLESFDLILDVMNGFSAKIGSIVPLGLGYSGHKNHRVRRGMCLRPVRILLVVVVVLRPRPFPWGGWHAPCPTKKRPRTTTKDEDDWARR